MLYIWPYVAFFSAPLLVGTLLRPLVPFLPMRLQTACRDHLKASMLGFPRLLTTGLFMACGFLAVHFNTIIHPYTLADNRHYVFYVFKMLRLYPALKYLATPAYYTCAWLTVQTLSSPPTPMSPVGKRRPGEKTKTSLSKDMADRQPCQISFVRGNCSSCRASVFHHPMDRLAASCALWSKHEFEKPIRHKNDPGDHVATCYQRSSIIYVSVPHIYLV
jgi:alpha-1,2-glucosyltransferase